MTDPSKLARAKNMPAHLAQLRQLTGRNVQPVDLLSPQDTETIRKGTTAHASMPSKRLDISFEDKSSPRFRKLIRSLHDLNPSPVYVWTPLSNLCGLFSPIPLREVNFDFGFSLITEGILVILTSDSLDKMLMDFDENNEGKQALEVELSGDHWSQASY